MATYVLRRLMLAASVVIAVSFAAFVAFGLSLDPSFPLAFKPRYQAVVRAAYHLSDPILSRYWRWVSGLAHHGFGTTVSTTVVGAPPRLAQPGLPIGPALLHATAVSAALVALSLVFVALGSTAIGVFAAERQRFGADVGARTLAYLGAAIPTFLLADLVRRAVAPNEQAAFRTVSSRLLRTRAGSSSGRR